MTLRIPSAAIALGLMSLLGASTPVSAQAGTASQTFLVTATVLAYCTIVPQALAFSNYTPSAALNATTTIAVTCTNASPYNVGLDPGISTSATVTTRKMQNGSALLSYTLYRDSARSLNWGNTPGTDTLGGTGNGAAQTLTVYGTIPINQLVTTGNYSDTITATITY